MEKNLRARGGGRPELADTFRGASRDFEEIQTQNLEYRLFKQNKWSDTVQGRAASGFSEKLEHFPKIPIKIQFWVKYRHRAASGIPENTDTAKCSKKSAIADLYRSTEDRAVRPACHWAGDVDF